MSDDRPPAWRCTVCGYVHHSPRPPDDCPVCGADGRFFEAVIRHSAGSGGLSTRPGAPEMASSLIGVQE